MYQKTYTDELQHYGVLGMKWGVRRSVKTSPSSKKSISPMSKKRC